MTNKEIMAAYRYAYKMAGDLSETFAPQPTPEEQLAQKEKLQQQLQQPKRPSLVNGIGRAIRWGQAARGVYDNALTPEQRAALVQAGQAAAQAAQNGVNRVVNPDRHAAGQAGVNAANGILNRLDRHNQNLQNGTVAPAKPGILQRANQAVENYQKRPLGQLPGAVPDSVNQEELRKALGH